MVLYLIVSLYSTTLFCTVKFWKHAQRPIFTSLCTFFRVDQKIDNTIEVESTTSRYGIIITGLIDAYFYFCDLMFQCQLFKSHL